jgi:C-terminal processing protease CtpA/Prc
MEDLNAKTLYLRIPSFAIEYKYIIDKVLADNKEKILKTDNLIIDLRGNGGGSGSSFLELIPFIYTNPIQVTNEEYLSSELNIRTFLEYSFTTKKHCALYPTENLRQWARMVYYKLNMCKTGEFVTFSDEPFSIIQQDTINEYPKKVGIIINEGCASTTEQFLYAAKQSSKVQLFGATTIGAFDVSAVNCVESPCKEFRLWYCMSRKLGISEYAIDDVGIQTRLLYR